MPSSTAAINAIQRRRIGPAQMLIAAFAILIHALILLIPLRKATSPVRQSAIEIELQAPAMSKAAPRQEGPANVSSRQAMTQDDPVRQPVTPVLPAEPGATQDEGESHRPSGAYRRTINAAILLEHAKQMGVPSRPEPGSQLGRPGNVHREGWTNEPILPVTGTVFDGKFLPSETEVLDQWQDPSGKRHVVMRTPSGQTLCGQLEPWDPLNPLVEPVAMYRLCAGGGRRERQQ